MRAQPGVNGSATTVHSPGGERADLERAELRVGVHERRAEVRVHGLNVRTAHGLAAGVDQAPHDSGRRQSLGLGAQHHFARPCVHRFKCRDRQR